MSLRGRACGDLYLVSAITQHLGLHKKWVEKKGPLPHCVQVPEGATGPLLHWEQVTAGATGPLPSPGPSLHAPGSLLVPAPLHSLLHWLLPVCIIALKHKPSSLLRVLDPVSAAVRMWVLPVTLCRDTPTL